VFRSKAERKVKAAGYDPARLPPGQYLTEKWPVLHAGSVAEYPKDLSGWSFRVWGEVDTPLELDWAGFSALPQSTVVQDIHCVTRWSRFDVAVTGVAWSTISERVGQRPAGRYAIAHAEGGYTANVPSSPLTPTASRSRPSMAGPFDSSSRVSTSGRAPSGCGESSL
jgi:DMSO/TMAO reductase YedYZ molybdopterin-dependent catalytic subunit